MKRVFISVPTSGVVVDGKLTEAFFKQIATYEEENNCIGISPMVMGYPLLPYKNKAATWDEWKDVCISLMQICSELVVFKFSGWEKSTGVTEEIKFAKSMNIPIIEIEV